MGQACFALKVFDCHDSRTAALGCSRWYAMEQGHAATDLFSWIRCGRIEMAGCTVLV